MRSKNISIFAAVAGLLAFLLASFLVFSLVFAESRIYDAGSSTSINWANGTQQYTTASCGPFTFSNMADGGNYTLAVRGASPGTCSFSQPGLTFRMPQSHSATEASTHTLYFFVRMGAVVYVSWIRGV